MEDGLDVVAVRIADERAEVARVVFGPQSRRVQRLGPQVHGGSWKAVTASAPEAWNAT